MTTLRLCMFPFAVAVALSGCTDGNEPWLQVREQTAAASDVDTYGWGTGNGLSIVQPGSISFPYPLAVELRVMHVLENDIDHHIEELAFASPRVDIVAGSACHLTLDPSCRYDACVAELSVDAPGTCMVAAHATLPSGSVVGDCLFEAIQERANVTQAEQDRLSAEVQAAFTACQANL